jgi:hypothetical protein
VAPFVEGLALRLNYNDYFRTAAAHPRPSSERGGGALARRRETSDRLKLACE